MSFGKALFVAWSMWIGALVVGSIIVLLLDKPEWRVEVGMLSLVIGLLAFVYSRRKYRGADK
jgi:membrane protein implicated in regulation of membrane protease activity